MTIHRLWRCQAAIYFFITLFVTACGGGAAPAPVPEPTISAQPVSLTVNAGLSATFSVTATGATSYQWQNNGVAIAGATSASYTVASATSADNGSSYSVVVSNAGGSVTSAAATLRVTGISVLAGQIGGEGYADGTASQARFWGPTGIALDAAGNLYVADDNAIRKITPDGVVSTLAGSPRTCGDQAGAGPGALLCDPSGVAVDASGNVYAVDSSATVWKIDSTGSMTVDATAPFGCPSGVAVFSTLLYVSDGCQGGIAVVNAGQYGAFTGVTPNSPVAISTDAYQNIYIANNSVVQEFNFATNTVSTLAGSVGITGSADGTGSAAQFGCSLQGTGFSYGQSSANGAAGIATTASGVSYVTDYCNNEIRVVTAAGVVTTLAGSTNAPGAGNGTGSAAQFWGPSGIVLDPSGNLYVTDYLNALIRKITPAGEVSTYAGQTPHAGSTDGPALQSSFRYPFGIVVDSTGNLFVTDTNNNTIRKITPSGTVSTLAGQPAVDGSANGTGSAARFAHPEGIAIDSKGNLFVADTLNQIIREVTPDGVVTTIAGIVRTAGSADGGPGVASFNYPAGVAIDAADNIYVADFSGVRLVVPNGPVTTLTTTLRAVCGLTYANGMLYATTNSATGGYVYSVTTSGTATLITNAAGHGFLPGIVMGGDGNLYVGDRQGSQINRVSLSGTVTTVVGTYALPIGVVTGGLPGNLNAPSGLALLSTGSSVSLAVVDAFEHAVLRVDLP